MKNKLSVELVVGLLLIALLFLLLNPLQWWMTSSLSMMVVLALIIIFGVFITFVWREQSRDEREEIQRMKVDRVAFLAGATILIMGLVFQALQHTIDYWLVLALGAMILGKTIGWMRNL